MVTNSLQSKKKNLEYAPRMFESYSKTYLCFPMEKPLQRCNRVSCEISANFCFQIWTRMKVGNNKEKQTSDDLI